MCPQAVRTRMTTSSEDQEMAIEQAAADGMFEPADVAQMVLDAIHEEQFLNTPHAAVREYIQRKDKIQTAG